MTQEIDSTREPHWRPEDLLGTLSVRDFLLSNDYRVLALKGVLTSLVMLGLAGLFALTFRAELTLPGIQMIGARPYMVLMTLHGLLMVFGFVIPIVISLCYYMLPKLLGMDRLLWADGAQASYWTWSPPPSCSSSGGPTSPGPSMRP